MEFRCFYVRLLFLLFFVGFLTSSVTRVRADEQRKPDEHRNKKYVTSSSLGHPDAQLRRFAMKQKAPRSELSITDILKKLKHFYNKQEPPSKDHPTEVKLGIYVNSFYSINEQTMDYSVSMYLRQSWDDKRLAFEKYNSRLKHIRMGENSWSEIWVPDTFFRNEKGANFHEVTVNNRMLRLGSDGNLWYVTKISATLSCPMNLQKYPLDTQSCPMMFESFGYTMDTMYFTWLDNPVDIEQGLQLPQFTLEETIRYDCSQNYTAGAFPCLELQFVLRRDIGFFLIQVYVPSILIVILSWVSFWINVDASPARVSIGLLTVLTTTTMSAGARSTLPRVSYIKAIDVWMIICLVFVFTSLIEYAVVNVLSRKAAKPPPQHARRKPPTTLSLSDNNACHRQIPVQQMNQDHRNGPLPGTAAREAIRGPPMHGLSLQGALPPLQGPPPQVSAPPPSLETLDGRYQARRIDKLSRKFFPLAFLLFNIIYWIVYTMPSTVKKET